MLTRDEIDEIDREFFIEPAHKEDKEREKILAEFDAELAAYTTPAHNNSNPFSFFYPETTKRHYCDELLEFIAETEVLSTQGSKSSIYDLSILQNYLNYNFLLSLADISPLTPANGKQDPAHQAKSSTL